MKRGEPGNSAFFRLPPVAFPHGFGRIVGAASASMIRPPADVADSGMLFADARGALRFVLECMRELNPGRDQVIIPAYTCYSVPAAVIAAGCRVVLCDVRPDSLDFDHDRLRSHAGPRTLAIVAGHLFRAPVDYRALRRIAGASGAFVVDDAAQGGDTESLESCAVHARIRSFGRGKPVSAGGGGLLQVADGPLATVVAREWAGLSGSGRGTGLASALVTVAGTLLTHPRLYWLPAGLPFLRLGVTRYPDCVDKARGSSFVHAMLSRSSAVAEGLDFLRREHTRHYRRGLARVGHQPVVHGDATYAPHRFPVYVRPRARSACLKTAGRFGVSRMYPGTLDRLPQLTGRLVNGGEPMPGAAWIADRLLTLPTHHRVRARDREAIIRAVRRACR